VARRSIRSQVCAALGAVLLLASCGGGAPLSISEYTQRADEECASLEEASNAFRKAMNPTVSDSDVRGFVHDVAERLRKLVSNLDELEAPEALEAQSDELLDVLSQYADGLDELADKVKPGQSFQDVQLANPETVGDLNELAVRATELVGELGFVSCILPAG
jgi:hypothetical protein